MRAPKEYLSSAQVAELKECCRDTVNNARLSGTLRASVMVGNAYGYDPKEVDDWTPRAEPGRPRNEEQ